MRRSLHDIERNSRLGEYDCPYCKQTSLRMRASRCPLCTAEIEDNYWTIVDERRRIAERTAVDERLRREIAALESRLSDPDLLDAGNAEALERRVAGYERVSNICLTMSLGGTVVAVIVWLILGLSQSGVLNVIGTLFIYSFVIGLPWGGVNVLILGVAERQESAWSHARERLGRHTQALARRQDTESSLAALRTRSRTA